MKVLVTGFEPFGGEKVNASLEAVRRLRARIGALEIATTVLPTSYSRSLPALEAAIARTCASSGWRSTSRMRPPPTTTARGPWIRPS
jgi:pyrrolidone-carboxylate peptidase